MKSPPKQASTELEEAVYLLFVKTSTLPVGLAKFRPQPEPTGTTIVSLMSAKVVEGEELYRAIASYGDLIKSMGFKGTYGDVSESGYQREVSHLFQKRQCHPQDCEFSELMFQVDVYCSKQEGVSMEEVEYIIHMVKEAHVENPALNGYRLFLYRFEQIQDKRGAYKMAPEGFERVMVWGTLLMSRDLI